MPRQRGVALLEVLISLLIFSFGVLGLFALEARAISYSTDSENRNRAAMFANEVASNMWLQNSVTIPSATLALLNTRVSNQAQGGLPTGVLTITAVTTNSADIRITWTPPSRASDVQTTSQLTTRVTLP